MKNTSPNLENATASSGREQSPDARRVASELGARALKPQMQDGMPLNDNHHKAIRRGGLVVLRPKTGPARREEMVEEAMDAYSGMIDRNVSRDYLERTIRAHLHTR